MPIIKRNNFVWSSFIKVYMQLFMMNLTKIATWQPLAKHKMTSKDDVMWDSQFGSN